MAQIIFSLHIGVQFKDITHNFFCANEKEIKKMARFAIITLYDEFAHGTRILIANLKKHGHFACMIVFKSYSAEPLESARNVYKHLYEPMHIQVQPNGDYVNAYSYPPSPTEDRILLDLLKRLKIDLVGISLTCVQQAAARRLTSLIKNELQLPVMWGGPQPTTDPDTCIKSADYVCRGEAEDVLLDVGKAIDAGESFSHVSNIWTRKPNGEIIKNIERQPVDNLDTLPYPDYSRESIFFIDEDQLRCGIPFPKSDLNTNYLTQTARGCPYSCTFCYQSYVKTLYPGRKYVRERSIDHILGELKEAKARMGHFYLEILDNIFTLKEERVAEFCKRYHAEINEPFWCYTHPRCCRDNIVRHLAACPNFEYIIMGVESVSDNIGIDTFHRKQTSQIVLDAAKVINKYGINVNYDFITNVPGETEGDCRQNLDLIRQIPKPFRIRLSKLSLFPNYEVQNETAGKNRLVTEKRYRVWNALYFLAQDVNLSDEEVDAIVSSPFFEENPEFLEKMNVILTRQFKENLKLNVQNKIKTVEIESRKKHEECLDGDMARLLGRKGMKQFLWLHDSAARAKRRLKKIL